MTAAYVLPHARRGGLGRMLVQGMARDLIQRGGIRAVEAFGDTRDGGAGRECPRHCVMPVGFLSGVGFKTQRAHGTTPRLRMDLRSALTWRDEVELALERLLGAVRPTRHPRRAPARRGRRASAGRRLVDELVELLEQRGLGRAPTMVRTTSPPW